MSNILISFSIAALVFVGCNSETKSTVESTTVEDSTSIAVEEEHHHEEDLQLDNGKKWVVVPEMLAHIRSMENRVHEFSKKSSSTIEEHLSLAQELKSDIDKLTSSCTMTGQAHDELHKWLVPYMELVDAYSTSVDLASVQSQFIEIQKSFAVFNEFFE